ncbi:MAG: hypothetical protein NVS9B8_05040 [Candidatus Limnocylindrales bacterium]
MLVERLPALTTFGSILSTLVGPALGQRRRDAVSRSALRSVIAGSAFTPHFQPIVDLFDGTVAGHEALTRFADGRPPNLVFEEMAQAGLGVELEVVCLRAAIEASLSLPADTYLSLNASPDLIRSGELDGLLAGAGRPIVLEVTEHVAIADYDRMRASLKVLGSGVRVAVDDAGAGYASFRHIVELAPDFVKIDIDLVRGLDSEPARQALIAGMGYFAARRELHLIAEGIETPEELDALRALGIPFGQGYLLGRPRTADESQSWQAQVALPGRGRSTSMRSRGRAVATSRAVR